MYSDETLNRFLDDLASGEPTPGGGSSAALIGAVGVALVSMVANFTAGREKFKDVDTEARRILGRSETLRAEFVRLVQTDIDAFGEVSSAYKLPRATDEEKAARSEAIQASLITATEAPLAILRAASETLTLCEETVGIGNPQTISDVGVGALAADACLQSAVLNIEINLKSMKDTDRADAYRNEMERLLDRRVERLTKILAEVRERL